MEQFDYKKYLKLWEETMSPVYYDKLEKRVTHINNIITEKVIKERPNYHPSDNDDFQKYRDEAKTIINYLNLSSKTPQQTPPDNINEIRENIKIEPKKE
jgi:hypothetical protein